MRVRSGSRRCVPSGVCVYTLIFSGCKAVSDLWDLGTPEAAEAHPTPAPSQNVAYVLSPWTPL